MPGFYPRGEYDLAGFAVGMVDRERIIDGAACRAGDVIIGLPSSGLHSNGYSLVRKLLFEQKNYTIDTRLNELACPLGELLLTPTSIYVKPVLQALTKYNIHGLAHITGGGFYENIPRAFAGQDLHAFIQKGSWDVQPLFAVLQAAGDIAEREMYNTFNMGIGMIVIADKAQAQEMVHAFAECSVDARIIGELVAGAREVQFG